MDKLYCISPVKPESIFLWKLQKNACGALIIQERQGHVTSCLLCNDKGAKSSVVNTVFYNTVDIPSDLILFQKKPTENVLVSHHTF